MCDGVFGFRTVRVGGVHFVLAWWLMLVELSGCIMRARGRRYAIEEDEEG